MMPIVNGLEEKFARQLTVYRLDAADPENLQLMQIYNVRGHPTFVFIDAQGDPSQVFFGPQSDSVLQEAIQDILP